MKQSKTKQILRNFLEDYYKLVRASNFYSNNQFEYEVNDSKTETLSIKEYHDEDKPYLKVIINNLKKSDKWNIIFISCKDIDKEYVIHLQCYIVIN